MDVINLPDAVVERSPFPHVIVDGFFSDEMHAAICAAFKNVRASGTSEIVSPLMLSRFPGYDAYCWVFNPEIGPPLDFFYSREWRNYFARLFDIELTDDVVVEFHHHETGSKEDAWHDDFNFGYFVDDQRRQDRLNPWYFQCNYMDAKASALPDDVVVLERVRSIAFIYYFGGEPYQKGSGGETGLGSADSATGEVSLFHAVEPVPNRLLAFEISPRSQHKFMTNRAERNTVIGWFHATVEDHWKRHQIYPRGWTAGDIAGGKRSPEGLPIDEVIYD